MARNRKRAKERRARRPQGASASIATAGREHDLSGSEPDAAPDPIAHAAPDVELAEAQLALGRPELTDGDAEVVDSGQDGFSGDSPGAESTSGSLSPAAPASERELHPAERQRLGLRLIHFLQGSWRELQRVQWPDRRQVMQATGVVLGFVIVAGLYLALADTVATKLMSYILK